jgi:CPA2 family monovalent cation:H+ antiporter-2
MHTTDPLLQVLILLAASVVVVAAVRKLALPAILGYLAVGMVLGPHALALAADNDTTRLLADFGVVFLVFTLGLEFSLPRLVSMRGEVLGIGGAQVTLTTALVATVASALFGVAPPVAVVIGGAVAMSSTAIIVTQLTDQSENNRTHGRLAVAICLFQDLAFSLLLALESSLSRDLQSATDTRGIATAILIAGMALGLVLAAGRWLLRPLFLLIASVHSPELFSLAVLLAVLASAWATHAVGLSLALGAFLAGMMLAETEFKHQVEATIRSYRDVLLGLFFITVGMLLDITLLLRHFLLVTSVLAGMLVVKALIIAVVTKPSTRSWFKSLRTGLVASQGGEFGFALLTLLLRDDLLDPGIVQPLLAATVLSIVISPFLIRHNRRIARALLGTHPPASSASRETQATLAVADRDHVVICGFGRVGQNIARVLEQAGFEYIALEIDTYRIRVGRQAGDPIIYGDAGQTAVLQNVGIDHASCVVITFASPPVSLRIVRAVRALRGDVPILVRTQDDTRLEELLAAGATEVVPETLEASLMLLSHLLLLLKVPVSRVVRTVNDIRRNRYSMLRQFFPAERALVPDETHAFREELHSVVLPPHAWAVGRTIADLLARGSAASVSAVRRDGILGRDPANETVLKEGDVVVVCGTPEAVEHAEALLLMG